jgi:hypothetical protein
VLILGGGGDGVRVRSEDFDFPCPEAGPAEDGLRVSSLDMVARSPSPLFQKLTKFDPKVLLSAGVLCVSTDSLNSQLSIELTKRTHIVVKMAILVREL